MKKNVRIFTLLVLTFSFGFFISCKNDKKNNDEGEITFQTADPLLNKISEDLNNDPNNAALYFSRAQQLYERSSYEPAISDLRKAIALDSTNADYHHLLSDCYLDYYMSGEALDILKKYSEENPTKVASLLKLGELQLILKQYDASFFTVQKILNLDQQNAEAFFLMGMIYRAQNDKERAINSFQSAVELDPEIVDAWIILGDLFAEKDFAIADRYYDNAISLDPENVQAYHAKAFYLQNNNRTDEAIALYKIINSKDPQYTDAYLNTGILYLEKDSLNKAYEHFDILVKIEPEGYLGYYYRGITSLFGGDKEGAERDLKQSLSFNPNFEKAKEALEELNTL
jgi:tetratricopeptide (TPR) repeat protein